MKGFKAFIRGLFFNLIAPFKSFSGIQWVSVVLTICGLIMAYADRISTIKDLPAWFAYCWPFVLGVASIVAKFGHIIFPQAQTYTDAQVKQAIQAHIQSLDIPNLIQDAAQASINQTANVYSSPPTTK